MAATFSSTNEHVTTAALETQSAVTAQRYNKRLSTSKSKRGDQEGKGESCYTGGFKASARFANNKLNFLAGTLMNQVVYLRYGPLLAPGASLAQPVRTSH